MVLSEQDIDQFRTRGYCVQPGCFDPAAVSTISDWLDALQAPAPNSKPTGEACYYEQSPVTGEGILVRVEHFLGAHNPGVTRLLLAPHVLAICAQLLGEPAVLFKEKVNYKLPGCRADKLHQDQAAGWNAYADFFITMAVAIDANRRDNAALSFLSSGNYDHHGLMGPEWQPLTDADPPYDPPGDYALIEANPGDAIFFDSYVPHGSPANTSARARRNVYITFNRLSAGDLRQRYYQDKWASYPPNDPQRLRTAGAYRV